MAAESRSGDSGNSIKMDSDTMLAGAVEAEAIEIDTMEADTVAADTVEADTVEADTVEADTMEAGAMEAGAMEAGADNQANIWLGLEAEVGEEEMPPVFSDLFDGTESIQNFFTLLVLKI